MIEKLASSTDARMIIRRVPAKEQDAREIALLEKVVASTVQDSLDWEGEITFSAAPTHFDRESFESGSKAIRDLLAVPKQQTFDLELHPGVQLLVPKYDRWWAVGSGMPWAHLDGTMYVIGSDGFSASGFGFYLEADEEGLVGIFPIGPCNSSWACFEDSPRLRSKAGAGVVVYDGSNLVVSRQPILWDVRSPTKFTGQNHKPQFGDIATPAAPGTFGTVPLAPVLAPIRPGRPLLVWFYHWHLGLNMKDAPFFAFLSSEVPLISVTFGKGPIVK